MDGQEGGGAVVLRMAPKQNNHNQMINQLQTVSKKLTDFQAKINELGNGYNNWLSKQSFPVQLAAFTAYYGLQGAGMGCLFGAAAQVAVHVFPNAIKYKAVFPRPMEEARIFAAGQATLASLLYITKRIRRKDDFQNWVPGIFCCGVATELMRGKGAAEAVLCGVVGALILGGIDQLCSPPPVEYTRIRCMLSDLGLNDCEKKFKKGLLMDSTIPLLTESTLKEAGIPPGARLLILDHIKRDPELQKMQQ